MSCILLFFYRLLLVRLHTQNFTSTQAENPIESIHVFASMDIIVSPSIIDNVSLQHWPKLIETYNLNIKNYKCNTPVVAIISKT